MGGWRETTVRLQALGASESQGQRRPGSPSTAKEAGWRSGYKGTRSSRGLSVFERGWDRRVKAEGPSSSELITDGRGGRHWSTAGQARPTTRLFFGRTHPVAVTDAGAVVPVNGLAVSRLSPDLAPDSGGAVTAVGGRPTNRLF